MTMSVNQAKNRRTTKITREIYPHQELFDNAINWYNDCLDQNPPISVTTDLIISYFIEFEPTLEFLSYSDLRQKVYRFMDRFGLSQQVGCRIKYSDE